jgi:hypothetical protein
MIDRDPVYRPGNKKAAINAETFIGTVAMGIFKVKKNLISGAFDFTISNFN